MPRVKVNPDAKRPEFVAVQPGEYRMKFQRLEDKAMGVSEKGNPWMRMRLVHTAPAEQLASLATGQPLGVEDMPGSVSAMFNSSPRGQGDVRQAFESAGLQWPDASSAPEFESDTEFFLWVAQNLDGRECVAKLKSKLYQGEWTNEVARYITQ